MSVPPRGTRTAPRAVAATGARIALAAVVAAGVLVTAAAPAPAAPRPAVPPGDAGARTAPDCHGGYSRDGGTLACFVPYGEHLWVCDTLADGHHPGVAYRVNGGSWVNRDYDLGNGKCRDIDLDIAESGYIDLIPRNFEGTTMVSDGPTFRVSARG